MGLGFTFYVGPELEYFYFQSADSPQPLDRGGYFDLTPPDEATNLRRDTVLALEEMGIFVEHSHHEGAPSQHEIDLHYTDALTMADNTMTFRLVVKEIALKHGVHATFMPKPLADHNGSGMHINQSLFMGDKNVFFDMEAPFCISAIGRSFVAGLLRHAREITLITNQWVNSYKRLIPGFGPLGFEAPLYVSWASRSRSDLIRVPEFRLGKENLHALSIAVQMLPVILILPSPSCWLRDWKESRRNTPVQNPFPAMCLRWTTKSARHEGLNAFRAAYQKR